MARACWGAMGVNTRGITSRPSGELLDEDGLVVRNGWYAHDGKLVWGYAQHNGWWGAYRTNITRNAAARIGPNRTEDLDKLTAAMMRFGYPAFEHNYGLWCDRRRERHCRPQALSFC